MNNTPDRYERIERLLKQARPSEASAETKSRIIGTAEHTWERSRTDVPWQVPLRRLAVSASAAVLLVSLTNVVGSCVSPRPSHEVPSPAATDSWALNDVYPAEYDTFVSALSIERYNSPLSGTLTEYLSQVQELLEEAESPEISGQPASTPGRSWLVPSTRPTQSLS